MKTNSFLLFCLLLNFGSIRLRAQTEFLTQLGGSLGGETRICQTNDGGYGIVTSYPGGMAILKTDILGNILYQKMYGTSPSAIPTDIIETNDHGFAIVGNIGNEGIIIKTDSTGAGLWAHSYESNNYIKLVLNNICEAPNGDLVIFGNKNPQNIVDVDGFFLKLNSAGSFLTSQTYQSTGGSMSSGVIFQGVLTNDNGMMMQGFHCNIFIKTNASGIIQWTYNPSVYSVRIDFAITAGDDFYLAVGDIGAAGVRIVKIDSAGTVKWNKNYKINYSNSLDCKIAATSDFGFVLLSNSFDATGFQRMPYIMKCDSSGNIQYSRIPIDTTGITGQTNFFPYDVLSTSDSGFVCVFQTVGGNVIKKYSSDTLNTCQDFSNNVTELPPVFNNCSSSYGLVTSPFNVVINPVSITAISLTNTILCSNFGSGFKEVEHHIKIYPNPTKDKIFFDFENYKFARFDVYISNALGKMVDHTQFENYNPVESIDLSKLQNGVYFLQLCSTEFGVQVMKVIITQ